MSDDGVPGPLPTRRRAVTALALAALALVLLAPWLVVGWVTPRRAGPVPVPGEQRAAVPGGTWRYQQAGEGEPVVLFLHGFNQTLSQWDGVWAALAGCPVRALRVDVPGFGGSTFETDDFGLPRQAERVVAFLDAQGVGRVTLVGSSMGGSLAVWLAATYPQRVQAVALLAPSGATGALRYPGLYGRLLGPGPLNRAATRVARSGLFAALFPSSAALQALTITASYGPAWMAQLPQVRAPTLLAWSRSDQTADAASAEGVAAAVPGSALVWLDDGAAHGIPSTRPAWTARVACRLARGATPAEVAAEAGPR